MFRMPPRAVACAVLLVSRLGATRVACAASKSEFEMPIGVRAPGAVAQGSLADRRAMPASLGVVAPPDLVLGAIPNTLVDDPTRDHTAADTQCGTALVLGAGNVVLAGFNDSGSGVGGRPHFTGVARSTDLGDTWTDQDTLPAGAFGDAGFPVLARSTATGTVILTTPAYTSGALQAFRSTNNGASYQAPVDASGGGSLIDRQWIACDNFAGTGFGNFYAIYRDVDPFGGGNGVAFTRSTNDGVTWPARQMLAANDGNQPWVVVGFDHAVYVFWLTNGNAFVCRKSTDRGVTFGSQLPVTTLRTTGVHGDLGLGGFRTPAMVQVAAHPNDANRLYAVWADKGIAPSSDKGNIYFSQSVNGGASWAPPAQVNADAGTNDQWQPVIAITPDGTRLFVSWYDRRLDVANQRIDVYGRIGTIVGNAVTFGPDFRITDTSFPPVSGQDPAVVATFMGDYDTAVADNADFYRTWGDNRGASEAHTHQPDVRFTKIPKDGPGPVVLASGSAVSAESCPPLNGAPDPNETLTYAFTLVNQGTANTTNLVATLLPINGVLSPSGPQTYGAMTFGGSPVSKSFTFTTAGACGGSVDAVLALQDGANYLGTASFSLPIGVLGSPTPPITYLSGNVAVRIPESETMGNMAEQTIHVGEGGEIADVEVRVRLSHTADGDLELSVVSPSGTTVPLCTARGGTGENFGNGPADCSGVPTVFDDEAATAISAGTAPFAASFRPESPLSAFDGQSAVGDWTLRIRDTRQLDSGTLWCWGLAISRRVPVCNTCGTTGVGGPSAIAFDAWQNQPNPFTHETVIRYALPVTAPVELAVYTVQGRRVATLVRETQPAGIHTVRFGPGLTTAAGERLAELPTGVYFYRLRAGSYTTARKMLLVQ